MRGYQLTFYTQQDRLQHGLPLAQWLLQQARQLGLKGATLQTASEGFGRSGHIQASHFFELSGQPQEITMAVTQAEVDAMFALLASHQVNVFYVLTPIEYGLSADRVPGE
ncbi:DUF190 domain-containing protein [Paludibacterium sp. B53371]|uniref:DUF190 domain-containing protein n=1 Tax=Paludibacterium sp. B53371 TaxID=2806263 RepID=UPI001C04DEA7|nr:DUF190 domain-containing protein [Paludibacterium sp. B53371]